MNDQITHVMPGCQIVGDPDNSTLVGLPSEAIKVMQRKSIKLGTCVVLPSRFYNHGINQANLEQVLLYSTFKLGRFFQGQKLVAIGEASQISRMQKLLQLKIFGPTRDDMEKWGVPEHIIQRTLKLGDHFRLVKRDGSGQKIDLGDLIEFVEFKDGRAEHEGVCIEKVDENVFRFDGQTVVDTNIATRQKPPIPINPAEHLTDRAMFGLTALTACTSMFDETGYTTAFALAINGCFGTIDGASWMPELMKAHGIAMTETDFHIFTHLHGDHSDVTDMLLNSRTSTVIADKLNYNCLVECKALELDMSPEEVMAMIKLVEFEEYKPLKWNGATFEFWPTAHPIPTYGFSVTVRDKTIVNSSDGLWGEPLTKLLNSGVIDQKMHDHNQQVPTMRADLVLMDCASDNAIHPHINDVAKLPDNCCRFIVPTHTTDIPKEHQTRFDLIRPGKSWIFIPQTLWLPSDLLSLVYAPLLSGIKKEWLNVIAVQGQPKTYAHGTEIIRYGQQGKNFHLILAGTVNVVSENGELIAEMETGDFFGEMSIIYGNPCNASIVAVGEVRVVEIPDELFLTMAEDTKILDQLKSLHEIRAVFVRFGALDGVSTKVMNEIILASEIVEFKKGDVIIKKGDDGDSLYGILEGRVNVLLNGHANVDDSITLYKSFIFGEMSLLSGEPRNANIVAATDTVRCFRLRKTEFDKIVGHTPYLRYAIGKMAKERKANK